MGPIGRLGRWTATHFGAVVAIWLVIAGGLGLLAPGVETALSGAGWEATGSESVQARQLIDTHFGGLGAYRLTVVVRGAPVPERVLRAVSARLRSDPAVATVVAPVISRDGRTAVIAAGAARNANGMVRAADR